MDILSFRLIFVQGTEVIIHKIRNIISYTYKTKTSEESSKFQIMTQMFATVELCVIL